MFRRGFFRMFLVLLLVLGLVGLVSSSFYRSGYSQGFAAAQVEDGNAESAAPESGRARFYGPAWGFSPFFWFLGGVLKFFLFIFFFGLLFKLIGLLFWRKGGRWGKGPWGHGGHRGNATPWGWRGHGHGGHPPKWGGGEPADETVMKA